jgi:hypothetical protein
MGVLVLVIIGVFLSSRVIEEIRERNLPCNTILIHVTKVLVFQTIW